MDKRIFVEKKADFRVKSQSLVKELKHNLQLKTLNDLRIVQVYDVFNLAEDLFARAEKHIFSEQVTDTVLDEAAVQADLEKYAFFAIESLPGSICSIPYNNIEEIIEKDAISIYKFFIFIPNRQLKANIFNHLKKMLNVTVTESAPVNIEIVPQNVSKGTVFDRLESIYNLKKPLRIAIGDSLNDLSMFESANISFAMGNSHQEIMKKADYVTVSNDKDGVSQAFERILTI